MHCFKKKFTQCWRETCAHAQLIWNMKQIIDLVHLHLPPSRTPVSRFCGFPCSERSDDWNKAGPSGRKCGCPPVVAVVKTSRISNLKPLRNRRFEGLPPLDVDSLRGLVSTMRRATGVQACTFAYGRRKGALQQRANVRRMRPVMMFPMSSRKCTW